MKGLTSYSGLTTKIKAMKSRLLSESDFLTLADFQDIRDAVNYLRQFPAYEPYLETEEENSVSRVQTELLLRQSLYHDFLKLYRFANAQQRAFLNGYFRRYELYFIKICAHTAAGHLSMDLNLEAFGDYISKHSKINFLKLGRAVTLEEFNSVLADSDYRDVVEIFLNMNTDSLFDLEMLLDIHHFRHLWKNRLQYVTKWEAASLEKILGSKFDILNIQWIHRSKEYYNLPMAEIYASIIPISYHLSNDTLRAMIEAETPRALETLIRSCYYGRHYSDFNSTTLEPMYSEIMKALLRQASGREPYSFSTVYSYLYYKEHEVERLSIALECVRYHVPSDRAAQLLKGR